MNIVNNHVKLYHLVLVSDNNVKLTNWPAPHKQCMTIRKCFTNPNNIMVEDCVSSDSEYDALPEWVKGYVRDPE